MVGGVVGTRAVVEDGVRRGSDAIECLLVEAQVMAVAALATEVRAALGHNNIIEWAKNHRL